MRNISPMREESVYIGKEFNSNSIALAYQHSVLCFIISEVNMSCTELLSQSQAIQSRVRKQNHCPCFGNKSMLSRIPYVLYRGSKHDWC